MPHHGRLDGEEPHGRTNPVPAELVEAAVRAAKAAGKDVAEISVDVIARQAGISRSTLIRRLGGSRATLDEAVRDVGVDRAAVGWSGNAPPTLPPA